MLHHGAMPYHGHRISVVLSEEAYEILRAVAELERKPVATVARSLLEETLHPLAPVVATLKEVGSGPAAVALLQVALAEMMKRTGDIFREAGGALEALRQKAEESRD